MRPSVLTTVLAMALAAAGAAVASAPQAPARAPDVIFLASTDPVVEGMLTLAGVTADDVVYDLGSGDGRVVIAAAQRGARGVGIEIDPALVAQARANAAAAGVSDRVTFIVGDIFDPAISIGDATVVTLFLLQRLNIRLMPRLKAELDPGSRVVSNSFDMGPAWPPDRTQQVDTYQLYFWTIPPRS
jgi:SAM-dependent methyltransferase